MSNSELRQQIIAQVIDPPPDKRRFFLRGPAGTGKTTLAVRRMCRLVQRGVAGESILVWVPQRTLGKPYLDALWELDHPGSPVEVSTVGGLARRMIDLFWPQVAGPAGFGRPSERPVFLTLETTQYYMQRIVAPYDERGLFDGLTIRRNRLCSQIIDNLNKAALVGLAHTEIAERLKRAWSGESAQKRYYDLAQACANGFRAYCLEHNLLDFSLQIEVFFQYLLPDPAFRRYLFGRYRHLIVDNVEEDSPRAHDLLRQWLPQCETALLVMDEQGGYRAFLGADPQGAAELRWLCQDELVLTNSWVTPPQLEALGHRLVQALGSEVATTLLPAALRAPLPRQINLSEVLTFQHVNFQPQMLTWVADEIATLIHEQGVPPHEIAVLAPFLGDALRFSLTNALAERRVPARSHRPSRALVEEPAARCVLTLLHFVYPAWQRCPTRDDVAQALMMAIDGLDVVRARLLTEIVYRPYEGRPELSSFDQLRPEAQQRIGFVTGERFERLRRWLLEQAELRAEPDDVIARLFQDVLARPGFGFFQRLDAGRVTDNLIESIFKFRQAVGDTLPPEALGREYVQMVEQGVLAATYVSSWETEIVGAVQMMPAYTFLMANRAVDVQFWLDIGSGGWWERLNQPLTHPYVLSRHWPDGRPWTDEDEFSTRQLALGRLMLGLIRRCRKRIYLGIAELSEQGYEQRGPLLQAVQRMLRRQAE